MSSRKQFDRELFNETDAIARQVVSGYIESSGLYVRDNPDLYGPDLIVSRNFQPKYYAEVEIKRVWKETQDVFPWSTIQLPERKAKFLSLDLPIEFWILRVDLQLALVIPDYIIVDSPLVEVSNKYVASGEFFFQVPVEECTIVDVRCEPSTEIED